MSRLIAVVSLLVVVAGVVTTVGLSASPSRMGRRTQVTAGGRKAACPKLMGQRALSPQTPEAVLRAARKQIPSTYRDRWHNQSGVVVLRPESKYVVTGELSLSTVELSITGGPRVGGLNRLHRDALRECGKAVANASWAVTFYVPESESVMYANAAAILAPTKTGWRLWYPLILIS